MLFGVNVLSLDLLFDQPAKEVVDLDLVIGRGYIFNATTGDIFDIKNRRELTEKQLHSSLIHLYGEQYLASMYCKEKNDSYKFNIGKIKSVSGSKFSPLGGVIIEDGGALWVNDWHSPLIELEKRSFEVADSELADIDTMLSNLAGDDNPLWLKQWVASVCLRPNYRTGLALILCGAQGIGKTTLYNLMNCIIGEDNSFAAQDAYRDLTNYYNSHILEGKVFVMGNELKEPAAKRGSFYSALKSRITDDTLPTRAVGRNLSVSENHINWLFMSNESLPFKVTDSDDRRLLVYRPLVSQDDEGHREVLIRINELLNKDPQRMAQVLYTYLSRVDLSDWDPKANNNLGMRTKAWEKMVTVSDVGLDAFLMDAISQVADRAKRSGTYYLSYKKIKNGLLYLADDSATQFDKTYPKELLVNCLLELGCRRNTKRINPNELFGPKAIQINAMWFLPEVAHVAELTTKSLVHEYLRTIESLHSYN